MISTAVHAGLLDPEGLLSGFGSTAFVAVLAILIIECGVIFGAVLPGDSLLFVTGMLIQSGFITVPLWAAVPAMALAAFAGNVRYDRPSIGVASALAMTMRPCP